MFFLFVFLPHHPTHHPPHPFHHPPTPHPTGLPVLTLPFCLATGLALCLRGGRSEDLKADARRRARLASRRARKTNGRVANFARSTSGRVYSPVGEEDNGDDNNDNSNNDRFGGVVFVDLASITTPEGHYLAWRRGVEEAEVELELELELEEHVSEAEGGEEEEKSSD